MSSTLTMVAQWHSSTAKAPDCKVFDDRETTHTLPTLM
jgi:hypothetical protein